jgi:hypothetical protein
VVSTYIKNGLKNLFGHLAGSYVYWYSPGEFISAKQLVGIQRSCKSEQVQPIKTASWTIRFLVATGHDDSADVPQYHDERMIWRIVVCVWANELRKRDVSVKNRQSINPVFLFLFLRRKSQRNALSNWE